MSTASDAELLQLIGDTAAADVELVSRRPYQYATSAALEELVVIIGGTQRTLIFKDMARHRLLTDARRAKPAWLYEPHREITTYQRVLADTDLAPRCYGALADHGGEHDWLVLEKVDGVELWQVGELDVWEAVARWLGRFHRQFEDRLDVVRAANPFLIELDQHWFEDWAGRAAKALARSDDPRAPELAGVVDRYGAVASALATLPRTLVHGELYPSNVLVRVEGGGKRHVDVRLVDWEMAGMGPALVDLAALTGGWAPTERARLIAAYTQSGPPALTDEPENLDRCRLHLALQWLGWAEGWRAPPEHAHDWLGEALDLAATLGLR